MSTHEKQLVKISKVEQMKNLFRHPIKKKKLGAILELYPALDIAKVPITKETNTQMRIQWGGGIQNHPENCKFFCYKIAKKVREPTSLYYAY